MTVHSPPPVPHRPCCAGFRPADVPGWNAPAVSLRPTEELCMSYPGFPPPPAAVAPPASRPTTLNLAFFGALGSGLFGLVASVLLLADAHDLAAGTVRDIAGDQLGDELTRATVDQAAATLQTRGVAGIVSALLIIG